jgi:hypothetical protein
MPDDGWATNFLTTWLDAAEMLWSIPLTWAHSWLVTALVEIISEVRGALRVGFEVLTDPTMLVQLHKVTMADNVPAEMGVLHGYFETCS